MRAVEYDMCRAVDKRESWDGGEYAVAHQWADGRTVQVWYFGKGAKGKAAALAYLRTKES